MSCGLDGVLAPLKAFEPFLLGAGVLFGPLCSVGSVCSKSSMGHGLGQAETSAQFCLEIFKNELTHCHVNSGCKL